MSDFYGIERGTIPVFAEAGTGRFISVKGLPERTVQHMLAFMEKLRVMYLDDPLAFEVCIRHVASVIEDQRREEGKADPRENPASLCLEPRRVPEPPGVLGRLVTGRDREEPPRPWRRRGRKAQLAGRRACSAGCRHRAPGSI